MALRQTKTAFFPHPQFGYCPPPRSPRGPLSPAVGSFYLLLSSFPIYSSHSVRPLFPLCFYIYLLKREGVLAGKCGGGPRRPPWRPGPPLAFPAPLVEKPPAILFIFPVLRGRPIPGRCVYPRVWTRWSTPVSLWFFFFFLFTLLFRCPTCRRSFRLLTILFE